MEVEYKSFRDRLACATVNWILRNIATANYCDFIAGSIEYGMRAAARDSAEDREAPADWRKAA
jgi:hypothetical protein